MFARFRAKTLDLLEANNQQVSKLRELERIEGSTGSHASEIAKAQRLQLELPPLLARR
jgi:hypothetical protein